MKYLSILTLVIFLIPNHIDACSMYKITKDGKTIVGNNEDYFNANTEIWFVPKGEAKYGVMNVGFNNGFPQGAINEVGLVFDGFAMPYLKIKKSKGKQKVSIKLLFNHIMHNYSTVEEVKKYLSHIDLRELDTSMLVFVDRSGEYLIIEGDELILGNEAERSFSNYYPSQNSDPESFKAEFYQKGLKHLKASESNADFDYCSSVMDNFQQEFTQYTTIYDLDQGKVRVYHYQNFDDFIELDIADELSKGTHSLKIPELFPKNTKGYEYFKMYNDRDALIKHYETFWENEIEELDAEGRKILEMRLSQILAYTASDWEYVQKDHAGAIKLYKLIIKLFPENKKAKKSAEKRIRKLS